VLEAHRADLERGVELLIAKETLTAEDFPPLRPAADKPASAASDAKSALERA
jgi:cell division protease FtsH